MTRLDWLTAVFAGVALTGIFMMLGVGGVPQGQDPTIYVVTSLTLFAVGGLGVWVTSVWEKRR